MAFNTDSIQGFVWLAVAVCVTFWIARQTVNGTEPELTVMAIAFILPLSWLLAAALLVPRYVHLLDRW